MHPTAPLYDGRTHSLKQPCVDALSRIFRLCDSDKDHLLNDDELNDFQRRCFGVPLSEEELNGIKDLVTSTPWTSDSQKSNVGNLSARGAAGARSSSSSASGSYNGEDSAASSSAMHHPHLRSGCLTLSGWLHLHTLFIQRGRLETTWTVLQTYGYGYNLQLSQDYLCPPWFQVPADCSVELSPEGYSFLTDIFEVHDKDRDGSLCQEELRELFATAPNGQHPWEADDFPEKTTTTDENGAVTLQGWLAQWSMTTLLDYKVTLAYLAYLGYPGSMTLGDGMMPTSSTSTGISNGSSSTGETTTFAIKRKKGKDSSDRPSPPATTTALKFAQRNTRRVFWSSVPAPSRSPPSRSHRTGGGGSASGESAKKKRRKGDPSERSVFLAYVMGPAKSGKSTLLSAMLGKEAFDSDPNSYTATTRPRCVVSAIEPSTSTAMVGGQPLFVGSNGGYERYLVLQEWPATRHYEETAAAGAAGVGSAASSAPGNISNGSSSRKVTAASIASSTLSPPDLVIYLYDSSDTNSFSYLTNLRQGAGGSGGGQQALLHSSRLTSSNFSALASLPTLIVATKGDQEIVKQRHEVEPEVYCSKLNLERFSPFLISAAIPHGETTEDGQAEEEWRYGGSSGQQYRRGLSPAPTAGAPQAHSSSTMGPVRAIGDLLAIACAIAQDPHDNGAIPGGSRHRRQGGGFWSWFGLSGLFSSTATSDDADGTEDAKSRAKSASSSDKEISATKTTMTTAPSRRSPSWARTFLFVTSGSLVLAAAASGTYVAWHWLKYRTWPSSPAFTAGLTNSRPGVGSKVGGSSGAAVGLSSSAGGKWWSWAKSKLEL